MGDPKKIKKKYSTPSHPWQKARIEEEIILKRDYGLKNKKEIWMSVSFLSDLKQQVKKLNSMSGLQAEKEKQQLKDRLVLLGLLTADATLTKVLELNVRNILDRRLQTILLKKNLARSISQARQFITHRHIFVAGKKVTVPSYMVKVGEEEAIVFSPGSALSDPNHPERYEQLPKDKESKKKKDKKSKEEELTPLAFEEVPVDEEEIAKKALKEEEKKKSLKEEGEK